MTRRERIFADGGGEGRISGGMMSRMHGVTRSGYYALQKRSKALVASAKEVLVVENRKAYAVGREDE